MSKRWGRGKREKGRVRRQLGKCITCRAEFRIGEERNTPKVCQVCRKEGIPPEKEWGCRKCMTGNSTTGVFRHKPEYCPVLKERIEQLEALFAS